MYTLSSSFLLIQGALDYPKICWRKGVSVYVGGFLTEKDGDRKKREKLKYFTIVSKIFQNLKKFIN